MPLDTAIHGLSNAIANEHWPRKDRLNAMLANWLEGPVDEPAQLLQALADQRLPDREAHPIFIQSPVYGTRCSTVIAIGTDGVGTITERRFDAGGQQSWREQAGLQLARLIAALEPSLFIRVCLFSLKERMSPMSSNDNSRPIGNTPITDAAAASAPQPSSSTTEYPDRSWEQCRPSGGRR